MLYDPTERKCVENYTFELGDESGIGGVDENSAVFSIDTIVHTEQWTSDGKGGRGKVPRVYTA